jgi:polyvinyl alcohol dehydrogenase (cytochrome)
MTRVLPILLMVGAAAFCQTAPAPQPDPCPGSAGPIELTGSIWNGWGRDLDNSHYQPNPGFQLADVPKLKLKWAFAYSGGRANGQPTVIGKRVFVTSESGHVYALNAQSGCTWWTFAVGAPVRTSVVIAALPHSSPATYAAYFGDEKATVHALDALTGKPLWKTQVDEHQQARITGTPVFYNDRL